MSESKLSMTPPANPSADISMCFIGLPDADRATFERVVSFCAAKGQHVKITSDTAANILVTADNDSAIAAAQQIQGDNTLLVVTANKACTAGDFQLVRPLLVTRVMRMMESLSKPGGKSANLPPTSPAAVAKAPKTNETIASQSATAATSDQSKPAESAAVPKNSYLALIVDDSAPIRKQLEIELRTSGMRSEFAESGERALEMIDSKTYDLIFLDIMMPGIDGYETCGKIRSNPQYKKTPVIMLSGKTSPLDEVQGVIAGASTYLTKPIKHDQFQKVTHRITRWLDEFRK
jgi:CheY-like chemotaxis protein